MKTHTPGLTQPRSDKPLLNPRWRSAFNFKTPIRVRQASASGFTLMETLVAVLMAGVLLPALFAGLAYAIAGVQGMRENLRATQILVQRMESFRLASYTALQNPAAYPTNSTEYYSPSGQPSSKGAAYTVTYNWAPGPSSLPPSYRSNVGLVTVTASWKSGNVQRTRSMQSYVARYGIQRYVSGN